MPMPKRDDGVDLPDSAFAPPPEGEDRPLELDPEWVAQRAAVQAAAVKPPPKASRAGVVIAFLLIAGAIAAIVWIVLKK